MTPVTEGNYGTLYETADAFELVDKHGKRLGRWPKTAAGRQAASVAPFLGVEKADATYKVQKAAHEGVETFELRKIA